MEIYAGINFTFGTDKNFIIADGLKAMICGAVDDGRAELTRILARAGDESGFTGSGEARGLLVGKEYD